MTPWTRVTLYGAVAVVAFDALASLASRITGVAYGRAIIGTLIIYAGIGFLAARTTTRAPVRMAAGTGLVLGLTDTTSGWATSWLIGPGRVKGLTIASWVLTAVLVVLMSAGVATAGGILGRLGGGSSQRSNKTLQPSGRAPR